MHVPAAVSVSSDAERACHNENEQSVRLAYTVHCDAKEQRAVLGMRVPFPPMCEGARQIVYKSGRRRSTLHFSRRRL